MPRRPGPQTRYKTIGRIGIKTTSFGGSTEQEKNGTHGGIDLAAPSGTPVKTPVTGIVTKSDSGHVQGENNFGNQLEIRTKNGDIFQFNHLDKIMVAPGQTVKEGQIAATSGASGATYSPSGGDPSNLDFRIVSRYRRYKDPTRYIPKI
jgi:murein DD-endopeptidase MepM/ murein hydrolase activator NlpD